RTKTRSDEILHILQSAFQQFNNTKGNGIAFKTLKGSSLERMIHEYIFRIFNESYLFHLNLKELSALYHFPLEISEITQLKQESSKVAPAPPGTPRHGGIILGENIFRHRKTMVNFLPEDRLRHFYVIGQ